MLGTAWAADKAAQDAVEGKDAGFFHDPATWVAVAFVLFVVLLGRIIFTRSPSCSTSVPPPSPGP